MRLENGTLLQNRYRIDDILRHEEMGAVYRGTDLEAGSTVAIVEHHILSVHFLTASEEEGESEEPLSSLSSSEEVKDRFEKEARLLSTLDHPGIPRVRDFFDIPGQGQYLVMDFVPGYDLEEMLEKGERPEPERLIRIGLDLCDVLEYLHGRTPPVIHRDIKPSNIRITPEGRVVLVGFGVGREQLPGEMTLGAPSISPGYSPLEQYGGDVITDERSDIYSLGAALLALATGQPPRPATERALARAQPGPVTEPGRTDLERVIFGSMAILPKDRYPSIREFRAALLDLLPKPKPAPVVAPIIAPLPPVVAPVAAPPQPPQVVAPPVEVPSAVAPPPVDVGPTQPGPALPTERPRAARTGWVAYSMVSAGVALMIFAVASVLLRMNTRTDVERPDVAADSGPTGSSPDTSRPFPDANTAVAGVSTGAGAATLAPTDSVPPGSAVPPAGGDVAIVPPGEEATETRPEPPTPAAPVRNEATRPGTRENMSGQAEIDPIVPARILPDIVAGLSSVELQWTPSTADHFSAYEIYYARTSKDLVVPVFIRSGKAIKSRDTAKQRVSGLRCGTSYAFRVRTVSRKGAYKDSDTVTMTTAACSVSDTLVVSVKGDGRYISIEDALADAERGSSRPKRLVLRPGRYVLNGPITLAKPITIVGIGPKSNVVIEYAAGPCFIVATQPATFRGVTIRSGRDRAVVVKGEAFFEDCDLASAGTCLDVEPDAAVTLRQTRLHDSKESGLRLGASSVARLDNCVVLGNAAGIVVQRNARLTATKCQILRSRQSHGVLVQEFGRAYITGCDVSDNRKSGVALEGGTAEIRDSRINKNRWYAVNCENGNGSIQIAGCTFLGNFPSDIHPLCDKIRRPGLTQ